MSERPKLEAMAFERQYEPRERAFSLLVPTGWQVEGGIVRANLMREVVSTQSIAAKTDLAVKRDAQGMVMMRICPEVICCDMRYSPGGGISYFPPGSNYMGAVVHPIVSAQDFITQMLFPWAHPQATDGHVEAQESLPEMIDEWRQSAAMRGLITNLQYDAARVTMTYVEGGVRYREKAHVLLEANFPLGVGTWSNKRTLYMRAPADEFADWEPILTFINASGQANWEWQANEVVRQEFLSMAFLNAQQAEQWRAQRSLQLQRELQWQAEQILEHKRRVQAEIRHDWDLFMRTSQEYVNPFTHRIDVGSNLWQYRWVTDSGHEFYTNDEFYDPNDGPILGRRDWQRTPVRPRYPDGPPTP